MKNDQKVSEEKGARIELHDRLNLTGAEIGISELPPTLLVLLLSLTLFPWIANVFSVFLRYRYVPIPEGYYYYTLQPLCSYYDGIQSPLPLFQPGFSELAVLVPAILAFFALLVSFHYISTKSEK